MKGIVIVLAICLVAVLGELTDEQKVKLREHKEACITESGVDPTVVENAKKGEIPENDEKLACFSTCLLKKAGIMNDAGDIDWEVARSKLPAEVTEEQAEEIHNACKDITGTGCEKGHNVLKCFIEKKRFYLLH
ncbi:PREDICTED: B2 protein-like [Vollenhovia emeryi]|uniref:B2 protein-like n=1 Tax=Vollenhovia emeryi TaxID=411798 RepID=UPI0005F58950|nr:PREDICTED: B2 protein-like [Vollenhovia emeryi]